MKKLIILALITFFLVSGTCYSIDDIPDDKKWHIVAGNIQADVLRSMGLCYIDRILVVWVIGEIKEMHDVNQGGKRDGNDVLAGCAGAALKFDYKWRF